MGISRLVFAAIRKAGNRVSLYTKKQSVEASINIGKELVDLSKKDTTMTKEIIQSVIKKHVPKAKVNIITDKDEFATVLRKAGENPDAIDTATSGTAALYFNFKGKAKGIFIPKLQTPNEMANFAHEFEHYMYNEHTPKRSLLIKTVQKISNMTDRIKPPKTKPIENPNEYKQIATEFDIQKNLINFFGIKHLALYGKLKGVKPTHEGVTELLQGENFIGLTNEKRVKAYIRAITRNMMHPKDKKSFPKLLLSKTTLDDEARAYGVSDTVRRYATGDNSITPDGLISDIYKRTSDILKNEIKLSVKNLRKNKPQKTTAKMEGPTVVNKEIKTGLPTNSYCGEQYADPISAFLEQASVEYGETIRLGDMVAKKLQNAKKIKISKKELKPYTPKVVDCGVFKNAKNKTTSKTET